MAGFCAPGGGPSWGEGGGNETGGNSSTQGKLHLKCALSSLCPCCTSASHAPLLQSLGQALPADADGAHATLTAGHLQLARREVSNTLLGDLHIVGVQLAQPHRKAETQQHVGACRVGVEPGMRGWRGRRHGGRRRLSPHSGGASWRRARQNNVPFLPQRTNGLHLHQPAERLEVRPRDAVKSNAVLEQRRKLQNVCRGHIIGRAVLGKGRRSVGRKARVSNDETQERGGCGRQAAAPLPLRHLLQKL